MKVTCVKCKKDFDTSNFIGTRQEFDQILLSHITQHQNEIKLGEWFTNTTKHGGNQS
jgi:hypothetical protein